MFVPVKAPDECGRFLFFKESNASYTACIRKHMFRITVVACVLYYGRKYIIKINTWADIISEKT